jgi:DNA-binding NtrC family response regulator
VAEGKIREDFYYRIHVFEIHLPPLRERPEDIPALVDHFVQQICERSARRLEGVTQDALATLQHYHWPGNVRQLRNAIEHACVTVAGDRIGYLDLPPEIRETARRTATESLQQFSTSELAERRRIVDALRQTGGNRTRAAELLGVSRVTLWKKMSRFDIELS